MKTTLLIPTLNEIEGMKAIMPRVQKNWADEIVVIDGGSTDGTVEYALERGYRVVHQKTKGITSAYREALEHVTGDVMITFSPDGNSVPERIPDLIEKMREGYDMVIVSRYLGDAKSEDDDRVTAFGNWMFTTIINLLFGGHYTDTLVIFRAWRVGIVETIPSKTPRAGIEPLLAIECARKKLKVAEIPGDEPRRIGGERKMRPFLNGLDISRLILHEFWNGVRGR